VGAFSHKFSIALCGETTDRIKKIRGAKMAWTSSITMPSSLWLGSGTARRLYTKKCDFLPAGLREAQPCRRSRAGIALTQ